MKVMEDRDELYDLTAAEVDEPMSPADWVRVFVRVACFLIACLCLFLPLWFGVNAFARAMDNYFDGYGFTPISHHQVEPSWQAPASFTIVTLPGEEAQR